MTTSRRCAAIAVVALLMAACQSKPAEKPEEVKVQTDPRAFSFTDTPKGEAPGYDTVNRVSTVAFVLWLQDTQTCRVQVVLPELRADGSVPDEPKRRRLIFPSVDKSLCGRTDALLKVNLTDTDVKAGKGPTQ
jgi:hypothetical protein